jgi:hypothetical protein
VELRHSGLGIASFILSLVVGCFLFLLVVTAGVMEVSTPGGMDENSPLTVVLGLLIIGGMFAALVAFALGVAGLFQPSRAKVFAVLGAVFSALTIAGVGVVMIVGILVG